MKSIIGQPSPCLQLKPIQPVSTVGCHCYRGSIFTAQEPTFRQTHFGVHEIILGPARYSFDLVKCDGHGCALYVIRHLQGSLPFGHQSRTKDSPVTPPPRHSIIDDQ